MQTKTDIANAALAYLGEMQISDINDPSSKPARVCKQFMDDTIHEVLRTHRWSCAIELADLTLAGDEPLWGYKKAYILPNDRLLILEVNGQVTGPTQQYYEIQGNRLLSNWDRCKIRYVKRIDVPSMDPLLANAIALKVACKICIPLSLNAALQQSCVAQFNLAVQEAKRINAIEKTTKANHGWASLASNSPLIRCRNWGNNNLLPYGYYVIPGIAP